MGNYGNEQGPGNLGKQNRLLFGQNGSGEDKHVKRAQTWMEGDIQKTFG